MNCFSSIFYKTVVDDACTFFIIVDNTHQMNFLLLKKKKARAGEIDQWFSVLAALPEDLGSIFSTYVVAYN